MQIAQEQPSFPRPNVIPAQAGIAANCPFRCTKGARAQRIDNRAGYAPLSSPLWIPACAGMTDSLTIIP